MDAPELSRRCAGTESPDHEQLLPYARHAESRDRPHVARSGKQIRDMFSGLPVLLKSPKRLHQLLLRGLSEVTEANSGEVDRLAVFRNQIGFVIERIDVAGAALHKDENDPLRSRSEHGRPFKQ
jgi:hypothetical protein